MSDAATFERRGILLCPGDLEDRGWIPRIAAAGLNLVGVHGSPDSVLAFVESAAGETLVEEARQAGLAVEYEMHALGWLLPRGEFAAHPEWFRADRHGVRRSDANLCPSHPEGLAVASERAVELAARLPTTTERYYFWADDVGAWCHCEACRDLSESDQNLLVMNAILAGLRARRPDARLACLSYLNSLAPPAQVRPADGIFLEYAPIQRCFRHPLTDPRCALNRAHVPGLPPLLETFGTEGAQVLEYWLDCSLFSNWTRPSVPVPFRREVVEADLAHYARIGFRSVMTFGAFLDPDYLARHGEPPVREYGECLNRCFT